MHSERRPEQEGTATAHTIRNIEVLVTDHLLRALKVLLPLVQTFP